MKKTLDFDYEEHLDFGLIGIICAYKDFRICFEIDKLLELNLCKQEDLELKKERKGSVSEFSIYKFKNNDNEQYILLANKGTNGHFIMELKHIDYFMLIHNLANFNSLTHITSQLKQIAFITSVAVLNAADYKSSENFLTIDMD